MGLTSRRVPRRVGTWQSKRFNRLSPRQGEGVPADAPPADEPQAPVDGGDVVQDEPPPDVPPPTDGVGNGDVPVEEGVPPEGGDPEPAPPVEVADPVEPVPAPVETDEAIPTSILEETPVESSLVPESTMHSLSPSGTSEHDVVETGIHEDKADMETHHGSPSGRSDAAGAIGILVGSIAGLALIIIAMRIYARRKREGAWTMPDWTWKFRHVPGRRRAVVTPAVPISKLDSNSTVGIDAEKGRKHMESPDSFESTETTASGALGIVDDADAILGGPRPLAKVN